MNARSGRPPTANREEAMGRANLCLSFANVVRSVNQMAGTKGMSSDARQGASSPAQPPSRARIALKLAESNRSIRPERTCPWLHVHEIDRALLSYVGTTTAQRPHLGSLCIISRHVSGKSPARPQIRSKDNGKWRAIGHIYALPANCNCSLQ